MTQFPPNRIRPRPGFLGGFPKGPADRERLAEIIRMHDAGVSEATIGEWFGITQQRVSQLFLKAKAEGVVIPSASVVGSPLSQSDSRPSASPNDDATTVEQIEP